MSEGLHTPEAVGELRHELRTPLNLIIGYCEMLLEDTEDPAQREALGTALGAGREVLDKINQSIPPSRSSISNAEIRELIDSFRQPQGRLLDATGTLLAPAGGELDPQFERDVRRIRSSAERLLTVEIPTGTSRTSNHYIATAPTVEQPVPEGAVLPPVRPARILVVDDLDDNRAVLERRLKRQGHTVELAGGGHAALDRLARERFDLVLLD